MSLASRSIGRARAGRVQLAERGARADDQCSCTDERVCGQAHYGGGRARGDWLV